MKQPAIIVAVGFSIGIALASLAPRWLALVLLVLLGIGAVWRLGNVGWLAGVTLAVAMTRVMSSPLTVPPGDIGSLAGHPVHATGRVLSVAPQTPDDRRVVFQLIADGHHGKVLAKMGRGPRLVPGDRVQVSGALRRPPRFSDFDYQGQLASQGIFATVSEPTVTVTRPSRSLAGFCFGIRQAFSRRLLAIFPQPAGGFLLGILIGDRSTIADGLQQDFRRTGTTHVLALSGYNISIIMAVMIGIFGRRPQVGWLAIAAVIFFVLIVGPSASVVRAALMGSFILLGQFLGRPTQAIEVCLITGAAMLAYHPWSLRYDLGFDLSFLATLGILIFHEPLVHRLRRLPRLLREPVATTLAAGGTVAPLIAATFGTVSLISPVANLLVVPLIPLLMLGAFVATAIGFASPVAASGIAALTTGVTNLTLGVVMALSRAHFASVTIPLSTAGLAVALAMVIGLACRRLMLAGQGDA